MKHLFISLVITFTGLSAFATASTSYTNEYTVEGMHCSGCKKMITKKVCEDATLSAQFESCQVELTDKEKQIGKITIRTKDHKPVNFAELEKAVKSAGEDYKLSEKLSQKK